MQSQFHVEQRNGEKWETISPPLGKGMDGFNKAKEWLENKRKETENE